MIKDNKMILSSGKKVPLEMMKSYSTLRKMLTKEEIIEAMTKYRALRGY